LSGFYDKVRKLYNSEDRGSKTNNNNSNNNNYDSIVDIDELRTKVNNSDFVEYAINTVKNLSFVMTHLSNKYCIPVLVLMSIIIQ